MSIRTNKLSVKFNLEVIEQDFAFLRFKRDNNGKWEGAVQLDRLLGDDYQAIAVLYVYGPFAYAMFKRPVDINKLITKIRTDRDFDKSAVIEVPAKITWKEGEDCICEAWLAQILLNSLSSSRSRFKEFHFCNLTGGLFLLPDHKGRHKDYIDAVNISIDRNFLLKAAATRHRKLIAALKDAQNDYQKSKIFKEPQYIISEGTSSLRRLLPSDGKKDLKVIYIKRGIPGKKASIPFLDFTSQSKFQSSRTGIIYHLLKKVEIHLSKYMEIEIEKFSDYETQDLDNRVMKTPRQIKSVLNGQAFRIIDAVKNEESDELADNLNNLLGKFVSDENQVTMEKEEKPGDLNFRIIHHRKYYEENNIPDEHVKSTDGIQRQHITIEDFSGESAAAAKTIVKELIIKKDIARKRISLFDWSLLNAKSNWIFASTNDKYCNRITLMKISPNGSIEFSDLDGNNLCAPPESQKIIETMKELTHWKNTTKRNEEFEGLIISESGDINAIYRTARITLPNLGAISRTIEEVNDELPSESRTATALATVVKNFEIKSKIVADYQKSVSNLKAALLGLGEQEISKRQFRILINEHLSKNSKIASEFRSFLLENLGIRLSFSKKKENLLSLFSSNLNIKYFDKTEKEAYYFVGDQRENVKDGFSTACNIRRICSVEGSRLFFSELLQTLNVDFVRTGRSTVLPFPFKYLREYMTSFEYKGSPMSNNAFQPKN